MMQDQYFDTIDDTIEEFLEDMVSEDDKEKIRKIVTASIIR